MAMTKDEFNSVLRNKTLKELEDWCFDWYDKYQKKMEEVEHLKKQKASGTVKETNKKLREENNKLKSKLNKILALTSSDTVTTEVVNADAQ